MIDHVASRALAGKVALVTGAGRGIGRAIAAAFARAGAATACAARTLHETEALAAEITAGGGVALALRADVTDAPSVDDMMANTVRRFGGLDILVVNAGVNLSKSAVEDSVPADWRATIETNLIGAYLCARAAIPHLKQRGAGKIIMIGSGIGHRGAATRSAYACSKAGLWMLTRVLGQELQEFNISVNELMPGPVDTSMSVGGSVAAQQPGEWVKQPEDVVPLALFLATQPDKGPTAQTFSLARRDVW